MYDLKESLNSEYQYLKNIFDELTKKTPEKIPGSLRISMDKGYPRYYHIHPNGTETFLPKKDTELAQKLAQNQYDKHLLKLITTRLRQIHQLLKTYHNTEVDDIFHNYHPERRKLISPPKSTYLYKYHKWHAQEYTGKEFEDGLPVILTERGERVRSKSEKILADFFYNQNIVYKYEKPLYLKGFGIIYPDFTFFSQKLGQEIYWEHDGRMDDPVYARNAISKINNYIHHGILPGRNLILTYETSQIPLQIEIIKKLAHEYLMS